MKKSILITAAILTYCILNTANCFSQGTAINSNGANPDSSAVLDAASTTKGFLLPRMTTAERNAILSPAQSLLIFNTTTTCFEYFYSGVWYSMSCTCVVPFATTATAATNETVNSFTANWNSSSGANTYYLDVATDAAFTGFVTGYNNLNVGGVTTFSVTGITCNTTYYYRARANNACGTSANSNTVSVTTLACPFVCGNTFQATHLASGGVAPVDKTVTYGTVLTNIGGTGDKCWITQNLGADNQATSATDATEPSAGWYWQFNRIQGYKHDGVSRTPNSPWIDPINENSDWQPANDPCTILLGSDWRVPTYNEWNNADINQGWDDYNETFADVLKVHAAGCLNWSTGNLGDRGVYGFYWCTSQSNNIDAWGYYFNNSYALIGTHYKAGGFNLRCIK